MVFTCKDLKLRTTCNVQTCDYHFSYKNFGCQLVSVRPAYFQSNRTKIEVTTMAWPASTHTNQTACTNAASFGSSDSGTWIARIAHNYRRCCARKLGEIDRIMSSRSR